MLSKSKTKKIKSYHAGIWAEYYAALFLIFKGYRIQKMRYKTRVGEIDIIAHKGRVVVFYEVKFRQTKDDALNAISPQARNRIRRAGEQYLLGFRGESHTLFDTCRCDVIAIDKNLFIRHIENAF